jgi:hypothetical protein
MVNRGEKKGQHMKTLHFQTDLGETWKETGKKLHQQNLILTKYEYAHNGGDTADFEERHKCKIIWEVKQTRKKPTEISAEKHIVLWCLRTRCFGILEMLQKHPLLDNDTETNKGKTTGGLLERVFSCWFATRKHTESQWARRGSRPQCIRENL